MAIAVVITKFKFPENNLSFPLLPIPLPNLKLWSGSVLVVTPSIFIAANSIKIVIATIVKCRT